MTDHHPDREIEKEADRVYRVRKKVPDHDAELAASKIAMSILKVITLGRPFNHRSLSDLVLEDLKEFHIRQIRPQKG